MDPVHSGLKRRVGGDRTPLLVFPSLQIRFGSGLGRVDLGGFRGGGNANQCLLVSGRCSVDGVVETVAGSELGGRRVVGGVVGLALESDAGVYLCPVVGRHRLRCGSGMRGTG